MVLYITEITFETNTKKLKELEKIVLDSGKVSLELGNVKLVEGKSSSFLGPSEDYIFSIKRYDGLDGEDDMEDIGEYDFSMFLASSNADTKKSAVDKVKSYLKREKINFDEEQS